MISPTVLAKFVDQITANKEFSCPVCGSTIYVTDRGNNELTFHCSSAEARFWDFERGAPEQVAAKKHWDLSKRELFISMEDVMKFAGEKESEIGSDGV